MGLRTAIDQIIAQVRATTPPTGADEPFIVQDDGGGGVLSLDQIAEMGPIRNRTCDVRMLTLPADDGVASASSLRRRCTLGVRVYYYTGDTESRVRNEQRAGEDAGAIIDRLADPSNWDAATTRIDALVFQGQQPTVAEAAGGNGHVVTVPFQMIYRE